jgi:hypothetical protein
VHEAALSAVVAITLAGCLLSDPCDCASASDTCVESGMPTGAGIAGGSATIVVDQNATYAATGFAMSTATVPNNGYKSDPRVLYVSFVFASPSGAMAATLGCANAFNIGGTIERSKLTAGTIPLAALCDGGNPPSLLLDSPYTTLQVRDGTLTVASSGAAGGNGSLTLQLDVPATALTGTDSAGAMHAIAIEADGLIGSATLASADVCSHEPRPVGW